MTKLPSRSIVGDLKLRLEKMAAVAAEHADAVDREARFPGEAFAAARANRLLAIIVPADFGGDGASIADAVEACDTLSRACGSSGMIFAMHQIMVAILVRHARCSGWHQGLLRRIANEQLLLASSTTEGQGGGDLRSSDCAIVESGASIALSKQATVMSYGAHSDAILTTARRSPEAAPSDQVLVAFLKDDYQLEQLSGWDTLGMRGTCSSGFALKAAGEACQVLADPYVKIQAQTMMPVAHLTWSAVWSGLAASAVERARRLTRVVARRSGGQLPPGAAHLTRAQMSLRTLRASIISALDRFEAAGTDGNLLEALDFQSGLNLLKVNVSELAIATVMNAMQACGLAGYRNDGEFSVARHLRDVLSSSLMINNERILASVAGASMLLEVPHTLRD